MSLVPFLPLPVPVQQPMMRGAPSGVGGHSVCSRVRSDTVMPGSRSRGSPLSKSQSFAAAPGKPGGASAASAHLVLRSCVAPDHRSVCSCLVGIIRAMHDVALTSSTTCVASRLTRPAPFTARPPAPAPSSFPPVPLAPRRPSNHPFCRRSIRVGVISQHACRIIVIFDWRGL